MKNIKTIIATILVVVAGWFGYQQFGGGWASGENLIGSSTYLDLLPMAAVFADATTTASYNGSNSENRSATLDQVIDTKQVDTVLLNIYAKGGTATSTIFIRQMGSQDGTTFYDLAPATSTLNISGTTTIQVLPRATQYDPGLTTSTFPSIPFDTYGYNWTRFIIYGEDAITDSADGVRAWINAIKVEKRIR